MTTEEKSKAYDEALKVLHKYDGANIMFTQSLKEEMFPELKESEDERVRKALINGFNKLDKSAVWYNGITNAQILAWLKKQGEKLPVGFYYVNSEGKKFYSDTFKYGNVILHVENHGFSIGGSHVQNNTKPATKEQRDTLEKAMTDAGYTFDFEKKKLKKIEQNSAWSDEDEKMCQETIDWFEKKCFPYALENDNPARESIKWLKSLKDRVGCEVNCTTTKEWSEEDETNASYICVSLDCYYRLREDRNNTNGQEDLDKARNWLYNRLKSIRPQSHWKPSDEQMLSLERASNSLVSTEDTVILRKLLNDLKKLREE